MVSFQEHDNHRQQAGMGVETKAKPSLKIYSVYGADQTSCPIQPFDFKSQSYLV